MTPDDFRATLARLDLSQVGAARLFGVDDRTARRWACDEAPIPAAVAILLALLDSGAISVAQVRAAHPSSSS